MHWVLAIMGGLFGAAFGSASAGFLGFCVGALLGWQGIRIGELRARLTALERRQAALPSSRSAVASASGPSAAPPVAAATDALADASSETPPSVANERAASATFGSASPEAAAPIAAPPAAKPAPTWREEGARQAPPRPATAAAPRGPDLAERVAATLRRWFFEGNVPVKIGVLLLFFGIAAALRYAVEQGMLSFPIEFRLSAIAAAALAGLVWGWRDRQARPAFGLALQGGAIGVLLLTVFAAFRLYAMLPAGIAFALVVILVAGAATLAVLQNAMALAVLGFIGGYLGPVLISSGSGSHVALFSYYAVLNAAVFAIAWVRPWRALNLVGFGFTFAVGTLWGARYYRPELFTSVEPFLLLFFLFYVAIAVLHALRGAAGKQPFVDGTLVFGTPLLAFPLQAALLADDRMGLAWSAIAVAALYAGLAAWLVRSRRVVLLGQSFAALAVGFATLAVPLALSARWTSASWAVEGAALVWLGLRQQRRLPQLAGWALQGLAAMAYFYSVFDGSWDASADERLLLNGHALGLLLMALSALFLSWLHERHGGGRLIVWSGFALGLFWWGLGGLRELSEFFSRGDASLLFTGFAALSAAIAAALRSGLRWPRLGWVVVGVAACGLPLALAVRADVGGLQSLHQHAYWLAWFAAMLFGLWRLREPQQRGISLAHVLGFATAAMVYGMSLGDWAGRAALDDGWRFVAHLLPLCGLLLLTWRLPQLAAWPLADRFPTYRMRWLAPASAVLGLAWVAALVERGGSAPLPFIPLLNPVELFQLGVLLVAILLARRAGARDLLALLAGACLLFATFAALRAVHHATGADWSPAILDDRVAQAALTVVWSLGGVIGWVLGSRRRHWGTWLAGAVLMGVVLLKLLLVDRRYFGDLAGIVSFMAVGGLLVLVGRIAPTPPRRAAAPAASPEA